MFHSRHVNNKINSVHKIAPRIVYSDYKSTFQEPLDKDSLFSVHQRKAIEIYKHRFIGFHQQLWGKFSKLTELYHITSEHTMRFPAATFLKQ